MGVFYTKKGDGGVSHIGKIKIKKTTCYTHALGELDELNSMIGIVKAGKISSELKNHLRQVQETLFVIQANIAYVMLKSKHSPPPLKPERIVDIEKIIDDIEAKVKPALKFVISGITVESAWLDFLRAKSRKVERSVVEVFAKKPKSRPLNSDILRYLNRLSSLFFALARLEVKKSRKKEEHPNYS